MGDGRPSGMLVRPRRDADADALLRIAKRVHALDGYPPYLPSEDVRAFLFSEAPLGAWVVVVNGEPIGQVTLHPRTSQPAMALAIEALAINTDQLAVVARLLVSPYHRRRGAARALLGTAARAAVDRGWWPILDVATTLHAAIALYERCGWSRVGEVDVVLPTGAAIREVVYLAPVQRLHDAHC